MGFHLSKIAKNKNVSILFFNKICNVIYIKHFRYVDWSFKIKIDSSAT